MSTTSTIPYASTISTVSTVSTETIAYIPHIDSASDSDSKSCHSDFSDESEPARVEEVLCFICKERPKMVCKGKKQSFCHECNVERNRELRALRARCVEMDVDRISCQFHDSGTCGRLEIDHLHGTTEPRWIVCHAVNVALGAFHDDLDEMERIGLLANELIPSPDLDICIPSCPVHVKFSYGCRPCEKRKSRDERVYTRKAKSMGWDLNKCWVCGQTGKMNVHHFHSDPDFEPRAVICSRLNLALGAVDDYPMELVRLARKLRAIGPGNLGINQRCGVPSTIGRFYCQICREWKIGATQAQKRHEGSQKHMKRMADTHFMKTTFNLWKRISGENPNP